jgi:hypothetical protein
MSAVSDSSFDFLDYLRKASANATSQAVQSGMRRRALMSRAGRNIGNVGGAVPSGDLQSYAQSQFAKYGWGPDQFGALQQLWNRESGWNPNAVNPSSGAFGIAQILPSAHPDVPRNLSAQQQIDWGLNYIKGRYGSPNAAWGHSQQTNWY